MAVTWRYSNLAEQRTILGIVALSVLLLIPACNIIHLLPVCSITSLVGYLRHLRRDRALETPLTEILEYTLFVHSVISLHHFRMSRLCSFRRCWMRIASDGVSLRGIAELSQNYILEISRTLLFP